jgi:hypothetical protein
MHLKVCIASILATALSLDQKPLTVQIIRTVQSKGLPKIGAARLDHEKEQTKLPTYEKNEPEWVNKCSFNKKGQMRQEDVVGCGGSLTIGCRGGCITVHKVLFSCKRANSSNIKQLENVKEVCQGREKCKLTSSGEFFGDDECPGVADDLMNLWIAYSCDGGRWTREIDNPTCSTAQKGVASAAHWLRAVTG